MPAGHKNGRARYRGPYRRLVTMRCSWLQFRRLNPKGARLGPGRAGGKMGQRFSRAKILDGKRIIQTNVSEAVVFGQVALIPRRLIPKGARLGPGRAGGSRTRDQSLGHALPELKVLTVPEEKILDKCHSSGSSFLASACHRDG